jgi:hypothetical protein
VAVDDAPNPYDVRSIDPYVLRFLTRHLPALPSHCSRPPVHPTFSAFSLNMAKGTNEDMILARAEANEYRGGCR